MRRIRDNFQPAPQPRLGCPRSRAQDRATHVLTWDGWWQSGNPDVVVPRWFCVCGERFTDAPRARWHRDGELGPSFHASDGQPTDRPW